MLKIVFEYQDNKVSDKWNTKSCITDTVARMVDYYGLDGKDVKYHIISIDSFPLKICENK